MWNICRLYFVPIKISHVLKTCFLLKTLKDRSNTLKLELFKQELGLWTVPDKLRFDEGGEPTPVSLSMWLSNINEYIERNGTTPTLSRNV